MILSYVEQFDCEIPKCLRAYATEVILGHSTVAIHEFFPVYPTGFPILIWVDKAIPTLHFKNHSYAPDFRLVLAGQIAEENIQMEVNGCFGQVGIVLHPATPYYLFHKKGGHFLNKWCSLAELLAIPKATVTELKNVKTIERQCHLLLRMLLRLLPFSLPRLPWLDDSISKIMEMRGKIDQKTLARNAGMSPRHFRRCFKDIIGMQPKYFCKVIQINGVFKYLRLQDQDKLHHLALDCGYYDQAHFIHDFKHFIGDSPGKFLKSGHTLIREYLGRW